VAPRYHIRGQCLLLRPDSDSIADLQIGLGATVTRDNSHGLAKLRGLLRTPRVDRRAFVLRALELGVSAAAAYTLLGEIVRDNAAASLPSADTGALDRELAAHPTGKVLSPQEAGQDEADPGTVQERIERLRQSYGADRPADGGSRSAPGDRPPPRTQLAQEDWGNWNNWDNWQNWDNWNNWDNWSNWDNWGNG